MPVMITEADRRQAMRDARYWQAGHPERAAFSAWVTDGFRALQSTRCRASRIGVGEGLYAQRSSGYGTLAQRPGDAGQAGRCGGWPRICRRGRRCARDRAGELAQPIAAVPTRARRWSRVRRSAGRQRDLETLNPVGQPEEMLIGATRYSLADGRIAITRRATGVGSQGELTLEVAEPIANGRFIQTDLFRYSPLP